MDTYNNQNIEAVYNKQFNVSAMLFFYHAAPLGSAQEIPLKLKLMMFIGDQNE